MKISVKNTIYQAINEGKWLSVSYDNKDKQNTRFYIAINDIDIKNGKLICDIFNPYKSNEILKNGEREKTYILIDRIQSISILENTNYDVPQKLIEKINNDSDTIDYLEVFKFDNNILSYLSDCYKLDNDPFLKEIIMIDGIDYQTLIKERRYQLDEKQFDEIVDRVFKKTVDEAESSYRYLSLAINKFSIDISGKQYVVAYRSLTLDFKNRTLSISNKSSINKSFLISEDKKVTLKMYLEINADEFEKEYDEREEEFIELIKGNFRRGEIVNTRPTIFFLEREYFHAVEETFEKIHFLDQENKLTPPLKAFFGRLRPIKEDTKETAIVLFDKNKINIDQMRVVYNAMVNKITYVQGPPGTGKTETIFNVILSSYYNDHKILICSNNNRPIDDIYKKINDSFSFRFVGKERIKTYLPIIRLGSNNENKEAIKRLREIVDYANKNINTPMQTWLTKKNKENSASNFNKLKELLIKYERQQELKSSIQTLKRNKTLGEIPVLDNKIDEQIKKYQEEIESIGKISNEEIISSAISSKDDRDFQNFIHYSTLERFLKLVKSKTDNVKELLEILDIENEDDALTKFNKFIRDDNKFRFFTNIFPIIVCTNQSSWRLGNNKMHFDICIMDEAGQCNIATSLIPISKAERLLLIGDKNQLQPITVLEESINKKFKEKYSIKDEYDYIYNSILSTLTKKDTISKQILLRYHYRCAKKIASFSNQRYYNGQLELLNPDLGELKYINVKNVIKSDVRNSYVDEARMVVKIIKENKYKDVAIVTPFNNQAYLINELLRKENILDVEAATIHSLQGSEKSTIIMSAAISLKTANVTMKWVNENQELINVAVTRAKERLIFIGDKEAIDLKSKGEGEKDLKVLSDYIYEKGEVEVPPSEVSVMSNLSNASSNEREFYKTIQPYFGRRTNRKRFKIERNIPLVDAIKQARSDDLKLFGKKEFDVIVQVAEGLFGGRYKTIVVFEVDGGEHIGNKRTAALDRIKEQICSKYGIKLIRIANSQIKDYEMIIKVFESVINNLPSVEDSQMNLFEDLE